MFVGLLGGVMMVNDLWILLWVFLIIIGGVNLFVFFLLEMLYFYDKKNMVIVLEDDMDDERLGL